MTKKFDFQDNIAGKKISKNIDSQTKIKNLIKWRLIAKVIEIEVTLTNLPTRQKTSKSYIFEIPKTDEVSIH